jgi:hypothetical protein
VASSCRLGQGDTSTVVVGQLEAPQRDGEQPDESELARQAVGLDKGDDLLRSGEALVGVVRTAGELDVDEHPGQCRGITRGACGLHRGMAHGPVADRVAEDEL